jgi:hypothetical protein
LSPPAAVAKPTLPIQAVRFQCEAIVRRRDDYYAKADGKMFALKFKAGRCEKLACDNGLCAVHVKQAKYSTGYDRVGDPMYPHISFTKSEIAAKSGR